MSAHTLHRKIRRIAIQAIKIFDWISSFSVVFVASTYSFYLCALDMLFCVCLCCPVSFCSLSFFSLNASIYFPFSFDFDMNANVVRLSIQSFVEIRFTNFYYTLMNWEPGLGGAAAADFVVEKNEADVETFFASSELQLTISIDDKRVIRCSKKCRSVFVTRIQ